MAYRLRKTVVSSLLTAFVLFMLILAGPASAVIVSIGGDSTVDEGDTASLSLNIDIESGENVPLQNVTLLIDDGSTTIECNYDLDGVELGSNPSLCPDLLTRTQAVGYGFASSPFGYGFGYDGSTSAYFSATFLDGYGYGYGYGYNGASNGEVRYTFDWDAPSVSADKTYTFTARINIISTNNIEYFESESSHSVLVDNNSGGGSSGSSSDESGAQTGRLWNPIAGSEEDRVQEGLGLPGEVERLITVQNETITLSSDDLSDLDNATQDLLAPLLDDVDGDVTVDKTATFYRVFNGTGYKYYTLITIKVTDASGQTTIVEVIPKEIAADVSELKFEQTPTVIQADPIVSWVVSEGQSINYYVPGQQSSKSTKTFAAAAPAVEVPTEKSVTAPAEPVSANTGAETPVQPDVKKSMAWLLWVLLAIIVIAGVVTYFVKKKG